MRTALVTHADCLRHDMGAYHPARPERLTAIEDQLIASWLEPHFTRYEAPLASHEQLARVHPRDYVRAIRDLPPEPGIERVAIVDFDVHHGNGTEDIFSDDEQVLMASIFQHPFYPYSGTEHPAPNMHNVPLAAGAGGKELRRAVHDVWLPALEEFRPELVLFSAGFDAHGEDDMAMLRFTDADYQWVTEQVADIA